MGNKIQHRILDRSVRLRRRVYELIGNPRYSTPGTENLDRKLEQFLPENGFFVEAGALDGYTASNTYYLERIKNWRGVLIEPSPHEYRMCVKERPHSQVFNCALVPEGYQSSTIAMSYAGDLSYADGSYTGERLQERNRFIRKYREPIPIEVPARTLNSVLREAKVKQIDFFSLDVEGFELEVLRGLDLQKYRPDVMLIECQTELAKQNVERFLMPNYRLEQALTVHDYLFLRR